MLILKRRSGDSLILKTLDGEVTFNFSLESNQIKLAIEAPESVTILRDELLRTEAEH